MLLMVRRWVPERSLGLVTDSSFALITVLWRLSRLTQPIWSLTRWRLDAALYDPAPPRQPRQNGRPRLKDRRWPTLAQVLANPATPWVTATVCGWYGVRERVVHLVSATAVWYHSGMPALPIRWVLVRDPQEEFEPQALLCTNLMVDPLQILAWFVRRWRLEVTWQEARAHLATERAGQVAQAHALPIRQAVWYRQVQPPFAEAIAVGRQHLWTSTHFYMSPAKPDMVEIPSARLNRLTESLYYAA
jgi:hypothetical protein